MSRPASDRDYLRVADLTAEELARILELGERSKRDRSAFAGRLEGRTMALLFEKPSLRTKASFTVAAVRLGMSPVSFAPEEIGLGRRESLSDGARVLSRYFDVVVHRTFAQARVEELARWSTVPVVNGLTDHEHPCQALADLLTLKERFGRLEGLRIAWVGDGNNVCHSLAMACALAGVAMTAACPEGFEPDEAVIGEARSLGGAVEITRSAPQAVAGAHAVYTDTWTSMGSEAEAATRAERFSGHRVDAALFALARPDAIFLHCLPAHRGEEVDDAVIDSPRSAVFDQAENRLHAQLALMLLLLE
jgi:ornithine carbamoyltransferase